MAAVQAEDLERRCGEDEMGKVKIKAADTAFSWCVRERADWCCERCGARYEPPTQALHCSHFHGRGRWGLRFDPENADAHCYGCHSYLGAHPMEHLAWKKEKIGEGMCDILQEKANDTSLGKLAHKNEKEITKHYREQLKILQEKRAGGEEGYIEFEGWI